MSARIATFVLGGTGYVAGELLRLIASHDGLALAGILSDSQSGESVARAFPHLAAAYPVERFASIEDVEERIRRVPRAALFCAAPHGVAAAVIDRLLTVAEAGGTRVHCVDISADFRYASASAYEAVYKHAHGAPKRIAQFTCAVPEHLHAAPTPHVAHPGCFSTATLLAAVPLLARGAIEPQLFVSAVTGSTGAGRKPVEGTHHPLRHSDLYSYLPLVHRHIPEITACAQAAAGVTADFAFVPHSGPFARGIHATVQAVLKKPLDTPAALALLSEFYASHPFVRISDTPPRIKDVASSNYAHLSAAANGKTIVVVSAIDNLNKGAAGGAVQWMNRLLGLEETRGLTAVAPGWT